MTKTCLWINEAQEDVLKQLSYAEMWFKKKKQKNKQAGNSVKNNFVFNKLKFEMSNRHSSGGTEQLDMNLEFRKRDQGWI